MDTSSFSTSKHLYTLKISPLSCWCAFAHSMMTLNTTVYECKKKKNKNQLEMSCASLFSLRVSQTGYSHKQKHKGSPPGCQMLMYMTSFLFFIQWQIGRWGYCITESTQAFKNKQIDKFINDNFGQIGHTVTVSRLRVQQYARLGSDSPPVKKFGNIEEPTRQILARLMRLWQTGLTHTQ